jgi:hypothetical protein
VPANLLFPFTLALALTGSYLSAFHWQAFALILVFGCLGLAMKRFKWSRAPFALGLILGQSTEISLYQSLTIWGPEFLLRPGSLVLMALITFSLATGVIKARRQRDKWGSSSLVLSLCLLGIFAAACILASRFPGGAAMLPMTVAAAGFGAVAVDLMVSARRGKAQLTSAITESGGRLPWIEPVLWLLAFTGTVCLLGLSPGLPVLTGLYLNRVADLSMQRAILTGTIMLLLFELILAYALGLSIFRGIMFMGI